MGSASGQFETRADANQHAPVKSACGNVAGHLRCRLAQFKLDAQLLNLQRLLVELRGENFRPAISKLGFDDGARLSKTSFAIAPKDFKISTKKSARRGGRF
jgi:hypothetical protein